jgi:CheY-like chemotaxis protein
MILIIDDTFEIIEWLAEVMREAGYHADHSIDGLSALYKMGRVYYSMALVDIRIPGIDGNELARRVKMLPSPFCDIPLVAMTGSRLTADKDLFVAILQKPFFPKNLRDIITNYARPPIKELHISKQQGISP